MEENDLGVRVVVFESDALQVVWRHKGSETKSIIVTFTPTNGRFVENPRGFGEDFLAGEGYDVMCFISRSNHWWSIDDMELALDVAVNICNEYKLVSTYGVSMGAYAAIKYSGRLNAKNVLAIAPQANIDPNKPPYDRRWEDFASKLNLEKLDVNDGMAKDASVTLVYDPFSMDKEHIKLIKCKDAAHVFVSFSGHGASRYLARLGLLKHLAIACFNGELKRDDLIRKIRAKRFNDAAFRINLASYCCSKKKFLIARSIADSVHVDERSDLFIKLISIYRKLREYIVVGSFYCKLYAEFPENIEYRDQAINYYSIFLRKNKSVSDEIFYLILNNIQKILKSKELEVLLYRRKRLVLE